MLIRITNIEPSPYSVKATMQLSVDHGDSDLDHRPSRLSFDDDELSHSSEDYYNLGRLHHFQRKCRPLGFLYPGASSESDLETSFTEEPTSIADLPATTYEDSSIDSLDDATTPTDPETSVTSDDLIPPLTVIPRKYFNKKSLCTYSLQYTNKDNDLDHPSDGSVCVDGLENDNLGPRPLCEGCESATNPHRLQQGGPLSWDVPLSVSDKVQKWFGTIPDCCDTDTPKQPHRSRRQPCRPDSVWLKMDPDFRSMNTLTDKARPDSTDVEPMTSEGLVNKAVLVRHRRSIVRKLKRIGKLLRYNGRHGADLQTLAVL